MRKRVSGLVVGAVLIVGAAGVARAQQPLVPCEASPPVRQALRSLPMSTGDAQADRTARLAALRVLLKRFPNDIYVHQRYQDAARYPAEKDRDAVIEEYRALAAAHPKDAGYAYLYARARIGIQTKDIVPQLEKLAGSVPPAHRQLASIYQSRAFKDDAKARAHVEAGIAACPDAVAIYDELRLLPPSDVLTKSAVRLRTILAARRDMDAVSSYSTLWAAEFRVRPVTEHEALRKQIATDLQRLRRLDPVKDSTLYRVLQEGYKLTSDTEGGKWASSQLARLPGGGYNAARSQWAAEHPYPKATDPPDVKQAYHEARLKATAEWTTLAPNQVMVWFDRLGSMVEVACPAADVETTGEGLLNAVAKNPGQLSFVSPTGGSSFALVVAHLYATRGARLDRLPALVEQGLKELESPGSSGWRSDLYPASGDDSNREYPRWYGRLTVADVWIKVKDAARARASLVDVQKLLDATKPKDAKDAQKQQAYLSRQTDYWRRMGDLAGLEGHKTDAMTYYQNALLARARPPSGGQKDELGEKARALWTELGGTNEGWQAWFARREMLGGAAASAAVSTWTKAEKTLPEFELGDLLGKKWRLTDFKGRATLVGIWATW